MARKRGKGCTRKKIIIRSKRSNKVIAEFMGRQGSGCGPRKKPSTAHLRHYKTEFRAAVKHCKPKARKGSKWSRPVFNNCIKNAMHSATPKRARNR